MQIEPSSYEVEYFKEKDFRRRKCSVNGEYFWTLDASRTTCGDSPCEEYSFFEKRYTSRALSVSEVRTEFIKYFEERGHTPIPPRTVVARWRNDLYLTIASIVLFQPFVTSGQVPPPANPLVVSQPCIRLADIDNTGLTAGRHMTIFEMGGHHAFNYPEKKVYWKDETVRYCFDFYTNKMGIQPERVTLKESVWMGGGNAGPCFEVAVGGLETATLVFMEYEVKPEGEWVPLPLKIVDTGYGIERMAWLSQGAPTGFHAVYGELVDKFASKLDVNIPDPKLLFQLAKHSALMNIEGGQSVGDLRKRVAQEVGMDLGALETLMIPAESAFAILDHTKTLSFMLSDGIVPSNSGEGYLARLILRRALRLKRRLGSKVPLAELVSMQIEYWGKDFPGLREHRNRILEEVELEEARFEENEAKASSLVNSLLNKVSTTGRVTENELIEIYDSNGVDPYFVSEKAKKLGVAVAVPDNFYTLVAQKHGSVKTKPKEQPPVDTDLLKIGKTKKLYYEDSEMLAFDARVLAASQNALVLDQTCFYPEGGGQPADNGEIVFDSAKLRVTDVQLYDDVIVHFFENEHTLTVPKTNSVVHGYIDAERRLRHTQSHDATHILLASIRRVLGDHVWQAGAQKGFERSRLDVTHYKKVTDEEVALIEQLANSVVQQDRKIHARFIDRSTAEERYGYTIYQGGVVPGTIIRIVEIEGFDVEACAGTHSRSTGQVGFIKILRVEQIQDGVSRFVFSAGKSAVEQSRAEANLLNQFSALLKSNPEQSLSKLKATLEENRVLRAKVEKLESKLADLVSQSEAGFQQKAEGDIDHLASTIRIGETQVDVYVLREGSELDPSIFAKRVSNKSGLPVIVAKGRRIVASSPLGGNYSVSGFITKLRATLKGKGGGSKYYAEYLLDDSVSVPSLQELTRLAKELWSD
jgi:alanyl-tRNA synthetase